MQSLEEKIAEAHALLHEIAQSVPLEQIAVAWTAGKDSTVSLHLWKSVLAVHDPHARVRVLNLDTGCKFPAVIALRDVVAQE
ncbi:MAG: phosphoadenosine phosphosulfate reductase family protein, partial [Bilophila sp.]